MESVQAAAPNRPGSEDATNDTYTQDMIYSFQTLNRVSLGEWDEERGYCKLLKQCGKILDTMGEKVGSIRILRIEEVLYVMERGMMELIHKSTGFPLSLLEARVILANLRFTHMTSGSEAGAGNVPYRLHTPLESYSIFSHLRRHGYIARRGHPLQLSSSRDNNTRSGTSTATDLHQQRTTETIATSQMQTSRGIECYKKSKRRKNGGAVHFEATKKKYCSARQKKRQQHPERSATFSSSSSSASNAGNAELSRGWYPTFDSWLLEGKSAEPSQDRAQKSSASQKPFHEMSEADGRHDSTRLRRLHQAEVERQRERDREVLQMFGRLQRCHTTDNIAPGDILRRNVHNDSKLFGLASYDTFDLWDSRPAAGSFLSSSAQNSNAVSVPPPNAKVIIVGKEDQQDMGRLLRQISAYLTAYGEAHGGDTATDKRQSSQRRRAQIKSVIIASGTSHPTFFRCRPFKVANLVDDGGNANG